jgi:lactate dehydrogenase-like 2-hydroxyacid dehydrogenase
MKHPVLQVLRLQPALEARLAAACDLHALPDQADPEAFIKARGHEFTGLVTTASRGVDAALIAKLPSLRVISSFGVGLDRVDVAAATARGIQVGYTPDVLNDCVADLGMALMLDVMRRVGEGDRFVRRGDWVRSMAGKGPGTSPFPLGRRVSGAKLGIVGLGRIGQAIARRAAGFSMDIRYHARRPVDSVAWVHEPSLLALASWADVLIVITAGGAGTRHLIDAKVLEALGPDGFLVNVARGSVVDEQALVAALVEKRIAGAGLDVYADEPRVPEALFALDNVVIVPHIASGTRETRQAMADLTFDNLQSFYAEGRVKTPASQN